MITRKMNSKFGILLITLISFSCSQDKQQLLPSEDALENYRLYTEITDPGEFEYLYRSLPESLDSMCELIKKQLIHPQEALEMKSIFPPERQYEDPVYPTVKDMLKGLLALDSSGLSFDRKAENRLVVACYHHAMLFASVLRYKNIPVRIRAGFAKYYEKDAGVRFGHVVCEVWNDKQFRWMLVDPDRQKVDFSADLFELPAISWRKIRSDNEVSGKYIAALSKGDQAIIHVFSLDISTIIGEEKYYWNDPEVLSRNLSSIDELSENETEVLDQLSLLMSQPDTNLKTIEKIYLNSDFLKPFDDSFAEWFKKRSGESPEEYFSKFK